MQSTKVCSWIIKRVDYTVCTYEILKINLAIWHRLWTNQVESKWLHLIDKRRIYSSCSNHPSLFTCLCCIGNSYYVHNNTTMVRLRDGTLVLTNTFLPNTKLVQTKLNKSSETSMTNIMLLQSNMVYPIRKKWKWWAWKAKATVLYFLDAWRT